MKNIIFCIDSYYQLIVSINLVVNIYKNDNVDLVLINSTDGLKEICKKLITTGLFKNVFLAETYLNKTNLNSGRIERLPKYFIYLYSMIDFEGYTKKVLLIDMIPYYDELFFYGYRPLIQCIFNACRKVNPKISCYRIDDGMGTYIREWNTPKSEIRKAIEIIMFYVSGFEQIEKYVSGFYVPRVDLIRYELKYKVLKIPSYDDISLINILNKIFNYKENKFESGKSVVYFGQYGKELVDRDKAFLEVISKIIPKENIIIKVHPRTKHTLYEGLGIDIIKQSKIPWELFMINRQFQDAIFVSQFSSAVNSSRVIFSRKGRDVYLYKCIDDKIKPYLFDSDLDGYLEWFRGETDGNGYIYIPESFQELEKALKD